MNTLQRELHLIAIDLKRSVDLALDFPYIQQQGMSLPIEERKELLCEMVKKQKRLIKIWIDCNGQSKESLTDLAIEKGALKVLENYIESIK